LSQRLHCYCPSHSFHIYPPPPHSTQQHWLFFLLLVILTLSLLRAFWLPCTSTYGILMFSKMKGL
jgi:hypothetical protein